MNWIVIAEAAYLVLLLFVILRVIFDTRSNTKSLAYILFIVFVPVVGMLFYFSFGINYRKRKLYSKKLQIDDGLRFQIHNKMNQYSEAIRDSGLISKKNQILAAFIRRAGVSPLTANNQVTVLTNGEEKFAAVLTALNNAKSHIHLEYYIYENDTTGNEIAQVLIKKAKEGVEVRLLYDDFGSHNLGKAFLRKLKEAGVQTAPFYKIIWYAFASRINYRNHRKIIIVDGTIAFVGGINISDRYRNDLKTKNHLYWRDTHLKIEGQAASYLQYVFVCDWNFCSKVKLTYDEIYFPDITRQQSLQNEVVQIVVSGPDSAQPLIFYSILEAISRATKSIYITSPYFIPGESLMDALIIAIQSGLDVRLLVPGISDSKMVNSAAGAYYSELLEYGAKIYQYNHGFVHAKTMVVDEDLAIVGSANMDYRSFDLNFEVNAMVYSKTIALQLKEVFDNDLKLATVIDRDMWLKRPKYIRVWEKVIRLVSPFL